MYWLFSNTKTYYKMTFVRKSHKKIEHYFIICSAEKFGINSFIKNNLTYLGLKFLLWTNRNFWFQKTPFRYVFSIAINVFLWDWVKGVASQRWNYKLQYKHYNGKKYTKEGGGGKDMELSGVLKK